MLSILYVFLSYNLFNTSCNKRILCYFSYLPNGTKNILTWGQFVASLKSDWHSNLAPSYHLTDPDSTISNIILKIRLELIILVKTSLLNVTLKLVWRMFHLVSIVLVFNEHINTKSRSPCGQTLTLILKFVWDVTNWDKFLENLIKLN